MHFEHRYALFLLVACSALCSQAIAEPQEEALILRPDVPITRPLAGGEAHVYRAELTGGRHWRIAVEQRGIDVAVEVEGPGAEGFAVNTPTYREGSESVLLSVQPPAGYLIEVRSVDRLVGPGSYEIRLEELRGEPVRLAAEAAMTEAGRLYHQATADDRRQAIEKYQEALVHWRSLREKRERARAFQSLGVLHMSFGEFEPALGFFRLALPLLQAPHDRPSQGITLSDMGLAYYRLEQYEKARTALDQALEIQQALGNRFGEAVARNNLCQISHLEGRLQAAGECYREALDLLRESGELVWEALMLSNIGNVYWQLGEPQPALDHLRQGLALRRSAGDRSGEGRTLNSIGQIHRSLGETQEALTALSDALGIFRESGNHRWEAIVLNNMGLAYYTLGEPRRAISFLEQALTLRQEVGARRGKSINLNILGLAHSSLGETKKALDFHRQALDQRRAAKDRWGEAITLSYLGRGHMALGSFSVALVHFDQALEVLQSVGDRYAEAGARHDKGEAARLQGEPEKALASLQKALRLRREIRDRSGEAQTLRALAQAEVELGRVHEARGHVEAALAGIESLRAGIGDPNLRASFLSSQRQAYELYVDLLMELHAADPAAGHARLALAASERARARTLLDLLDEAGAGLRQGIDEALLERRGVLQQRLNAKATRQLELVRRGKVEEQAAAAELELFEVLAELETVEAEIRQHSSRYSALTRPHQISSREIQELLGEDTLLLEYALGERRSFLWAVTGTWFASFELPGREEIEASVRRVYEQLSTVEGRATAGERVAAAALSEWLLGPVAERLDRQRLVVVADGALHYIPFGALPDPAHGDPLLLRHEVVHLPSVSALAVQRRERAERPPASKRLAILADPVFDPQDPRIRPAAATPSPRQAPTPERGNLGFGRLPATRREAAGISALLAPEQTMTALGFQASRSMILDGELSRYGIVHFATHGLVDARNPELSGLALSLYDEEGAPQDGFLRLRDIYNLELEADLVVLSGCQTALGREIRGEGLVGLTRGFMYAGVPRLVASLWRVQDRVTAELMTSFYRSMLVEGMPASAALRKAQISILRQRRWADPYFWAAFVLQGDWR